MIDTHCHLNDNQYVGQVDEIVQHFLSAGVQTAICIGCDNSSNQRAKEIAHTYDCVYYAVGVHPDDCQTFDAPLLESYLSTNDTKLVAVGEIGLDYHTTKDNREQQISTFITQIDLANKYDLPVVIHCRDAYGDMLQILKQHPIKRGAVMHCYSGSLEFAREILKLGLKVSFTGTVTFNNAKNVQEVAKALPIDSFFFETDSPYLAPTPHRGERNEPKNVVDVAKFVASLRGLSYQELEQITDTTARNFFHLESTSPTF